MLISTILLSCLTVVAHAAPAVKTALATKVAVASSDSSCALQPAGVNIGPASDTAAAFTKYAGFHGAAISAAYPAGYLISFAGGLKAVAQPDSFMTYYMLNSYNPQTCADYCSNTYGCGSFNIFFERAPTVNPAVGCPNPPSTTYVKCSLFAHTIASTQIATNAGQWRGPYSGANFTQNFQVVIAGSNAYNKNS